MSVCSRVCPARRLQARPPTPLTGVLPPSTARVVYDNDNDNVRVIIGSTTCRGFRRALRSAVANHDDYADGRHDHER
jgi:hypothetical protein